VNIRIRIPESVKNSLVARMASRLARRWVLSLIAGCVLFGLLGFSVFAYDYIKYQPIVDMRMSGPIFANTARIYAAPRVIRVGDTIRPSEIAAELHHAGYDDAGAAAKSEALKSKAGTYRLHANAIEIMPGPESFYSPDVARISFAGGKIEKISLASGSAEDNQDGYELEPQLVTGLYEQSQRSKRRLVTYDEIPRTLRDAIISIEDRRFLEHKGVNYLRLAKAAAIDIFHGGLNQGGSTLTMQFAKGYFLTNEKSFSRKMAQIVIALQLERRFSKQQIFETYVNWVPMGQRGSFSIDGMGEASQAYFGKDIKNLNLQECALLAAIIQAPSRLTPFRHPDQALERRNLVLETMVETGAITREQADQAKATPLKLAPLNIEASDAPYFVDMVRESLLAQHSDEELNSNGLRVYTTLDPDLQKAAAEAVTAGATQIDDRLARLQAGKRRRKKTRPGKDTPAQVPAAPVHRAEIALVAIDPHTGEIVALVGGRNYGASQLNHALASRPTGSIFKPFVYAAALNSAVTGRQPVFTEITVLDDTQSAFEYGNRVYAPKNFQNEYRGQVIAREALAHSLNNATVALAQMVGYDQVVDLARSAGIASVKPTPSIALGAYDATPLEMAGAYTVFANAGTRVNPIMVNSVRDAQGNVLEDSAPQKDQVLDPRVAYLTTNMMEEVLRSGSAAGVRGMGFTSPAAGKTGTDHDGWFAGYTDHLLCIVWVGFDDYTDLNLQGAHSAAPIWAIFMKKAATLSRYKDVKPFAPPAGVVTVSLDKRTNLISTPACPDSYEAAFVEGTEPKETCEHTPVGQPNVPQALVGADNKTGRDATLSPPGVSRTQF
jgi:penicillin-binding protein 1B